MPYTPPSHQSPVSSRSSTPAMSRNSSYVHEAAHPVHSAPTHGRPNLPKSTSSAAYMNKHRRSPSATTSPTAQDHVTFKFNVGTKDAESMTTNGSIRQSPPPLNDLVIPTGAIMSPPDSSENSDGDDPSSRAAKRVDVENTWNELQQAVRKMSIKRDPSPVKKAVIVSVSEPVTVMTSPTKLSPEARKISHSRSSTETALPHLMPSSSSHTSGSDDSDEDELSVGKPPLLRKKSGELVKPALRPSSRRRYSSMPGTPTYSKSVHFNDDGNQTRHFLQVDKPSAVSAGTSPVETYDSEGEFPFQGGNSKSRVDWEIKLANFPSDGDQWRKNRPVWVERFYLSADNKSLIGQVAVANISFNKSVVARFTLDYWKTTSEVSAEYCQDIRQQNTPDGCDRFNFTIRLADQANLETKTLLLCVRYSVAGQEYWDSNDDTNYQIDFVRKINRAVSHAQLSSLGASRASNSIPRSTGRHSPPTRGRARAPSIDDDMSSQLDNSYDFGASTRDILGDEAQPAIKLKPRSKRGAHHQGPPQPGQGLGGRYDFGASLSAALSTAQDKLGKQSGLMVHKPSPTKNQSYFATDTDETASKKTEVERPEALTTDRPAMGSAQYKDLVNKFCYFTPASTTGGKLSPQIQTKRQFNSGDGTLDGQEQYFQSGSRSPSPPRSASPPQLDGSNERHGFFSPDVSPYESQTGSPGGKTRSQASSRGTSSPAIFGYPYIKRDGYLSDSLAPTAIQG